MEMEGIEFVEALRILAQKAGVQLKRQNPREVSERVRLLDIMDTARRYYHHYLLESPQAAGARAYLDKRGLDADTIEEWQIGYSPEGWDGIYQVLKKQGYDEKEIEKTGMIIRNEQRRSYFDRFRGRIMFPINDSNGNIVAFTARVSPEREATEQMGKYVNSPQTVLYNKSLIIFALDRSKQAIKQADQVVIVEGQMDAITAHQFGYRNVVASSGTALTREQIQLLKRYSNNFALAFDTDEAGQMAADRGIREALKQDVNVRVISIPAGKDPDDCIRKDRPAWERALAATKHMMAYYFERSMRGTDLRKIEDRRKVAAYLLPIISDISNSIEKSYWLRELSETIQVEENVLREAMAKSRLGAKQPDRNAAAQPVQLQAQPERPKTRDEQLGELLMALLARFPALIADCLDRFSLEYLSGEENRAIYKNLIFFYNYLNESGQGQASSSGLDLDAYKAWFWDFSSKNEKKAPEESLGENNTISDQLRKMERLVLLGEKEYYELDLEKARLEMMRIILLLKKNALKQRMNELEGLISKAERERDDEASLMLAGELKIISDEYRELLKS